MPVPIRVLIVEDSKSDAQLMVAELQRAGFEPEWRRVQTEADYAANLGEDVQVILADCNRVKFGTECALQLLRQRGLDIPFVIVTDGMGQDIALTLIQRGATDYVFKDQLARLGLAVTRAVEEKRRRGEKCRAEQAWRESEERFQRYFELGLIGMAITSPAKSWIEVNDQLCEILGYERSELFRMTWAELTHPEDLAANIAAFNRILAGEIDGYSTDKRFIRKDGQVIHATISVKCLRRADGAVDNFLALFQDISERKRAEEALRASEEKFRGVIEQSADGIVLIDARGAIIDWNRAQEQITGLNHADAIGRPVWEITSECSPSGHWPLADLERLKTQVLQALQAEQAPWLNQLHENQIRHRNGMLRSVQEVMFPIRTDKHFMIGSIMRDITEQKKVEAAEREQRILAEALRDTAAAFNSMMDLEEVLDRILENAGRVVALDAVEILLLESGVARIVRSKGYDPRVTTMLTDRRFQVAALYDLRQAMETGHWFIIPDTHTFPDWDRIPEASWIRSHLVVPIQTQGKFIGYLTGESATPGFFTSAHATRLQAFADQAALALENARLVTETRHRIRELSALNRVTMHLASPLNPDRALDLAMQELKDVLDVDVCSLMMLDDQTNELVFRVALGLNRELSKQLRLRCDQGIAGWVVREAHSTMVLDAHQDPRWCAAVDGITGFETRSMLAVPLKNKERVIGVVEAINKIHGAFNAADLELLESVSMATSIAVENARLAESAREMQVLRELDHLHSELIANVSHELRTPLGLIKAMCTTLLARDVSFDPKTQMGLLRDIAEETTKLEQIVDDLLDSSRLQNHRLRLDKRLGDLGALAATVAESMQLEWNRHRLICHFPTRRLVARFDSKRIEQVLRNLVGNAIKYSPDGGTIKVCGQQDSTQARLSVTDQGIGIPREDWERVFERFYRVDNELTRRVRGAGLGLAVSRGIVEAHGGRMWVESTVGAGSTFYFTLPLDSRVEAERSNRRKAKR